MGYAAPPSSLATSSSAVCSAGTPHSPTANTPTTAATNYPSPIISVPAGPSPHNLNAMSHAMQQYTVEDAAASMAPYGQVEEATAAAAASYDYFSGSSAYPTQPFTTPDLTAELGYAQQ